MPLDSGIVGVSGNTVGATGAAGSGVGAGGASGMVQTPSGSLPGGKMATKRSLKLSSLADDMLVASGSGQQQE